MTDDRLALVGAASLLGREIKERLAESGLPGEAIVLLDLDDEAGLVTDYGDEARVVAEAAASSLRGHKIVCFCGDDSTTRQFAPIVLDDGATIIDCLGVLHEEARVWGAPDAAAARVLTIPHGGTALLSALGEAIDLEGAAATLMLPASELHDSGPEELAQQAAALLSFDAEEKGGVFGRRQAFDMWPDAGAKGGPAVRVRAELRALGATVPRLTTVRVPVFHSIAATLLLPGATAEETLAKLHDAGIGVDDEARGERIDSPARVAGHAGIRIADVRPDPAGGTWLWALADNYLMAASAVVEIAATHLDAGDQSIN
jgi:aspartate-semialdehyde dehydrogenase